MPTPLSTIRSLYSQLTNPSNGNNTLVIPKNVVGWGTCLSHHRMAGLPHINGNAAVVLFMTKVAQHRFIEIQDADLTHEIRLLDILRYSNEQPAEQESPLDISISLLREGYTSFKDFSAALENQGFGDMPHFFRSWYAYGYFFPELEDEHKARMSLADLGDNSLLTAPPNEPSCESIEPETGTEAEAEAEVERNIEEEVTSTQKRHTEKEIIEEDTRLYKQLWDIRQCGNTLVLPENSPKIKSLVLRHVIKKAPFLKTKGYICLFRNQASKDYFIKQNISERLSEKSSQLLDVGAIKFVTICADNGSSSSSTQTQSADYPTTNQTHRPEPLNVSEVASHAPAAEEQTTAEPSKDQSLGAADYTSYQSFSNGELYRLASQERLNDAKLKKIAHELNQRNTPEAKIVLKSISQFLADQEVILANSTKSDTDSSSTLSQTRPQRPTQGIEKKPTIDQTEPVKISTEVKLPASAQSLKYGVALSKQCPIKNEVERKWYYARSFIGAIERSPLPKRYITAITYWYKQGLIKYKTLGDFYTSGDGGRQLGMVPGIGIKSRDEIRDYLISLAPVDDGSLQQKSGGIAEPASKSPSVDISSFLTRRLTPSTVCNPEPDIEEDDESDTADSASCPSIPSNADAVTTADVNNDLQVSVQTVTTPPGYTALAQRIRNTVTASDYQIIMGRSIQRLQYNQLGQRLNMTRRDVRKREQVLLRDISQNYKQDLEPFIEALNKHLDHFGGDTSLDAASTATQLSHQQLKLLVYITDNLRETPCCVEGNRLVRLTE